MIRNLRCTVTIDSVLANSKTQNAFLFNVNAIFRQSRLPPSGGTWKYAKAPGTKKLGEILYLLICSFLPCLSWLLRSRVRKSRRDLWITLQMALGCFTPSASFPVKWASCILEWDNCALQIRSGHSGDERNFLFLAETETRLLFWTARRLVAMPTTLPPVVCCFPESKAAGTWGSPINSA